MDFMRLSGPKHLFKIFGGKTALVCVYCLHAHCCKQRAVGLFWQLKLPCACLLMLFSYHFAGRSNAPQ